MVSSRKYLLGTALTSTMLMYAAPQAFTGSCTGSGGVYSCAGAADPGTDTQQTLTSSTGLTVTTNPGFGIEVTSGNALDLKNDTAGDLTFTDANTSVITGQGHGIYTQNSGSGATSITATGKVTGAVRAVSIYGINARNYGTATALTIAAVDVDGGDTGIYTINEGTGATSITATGTATGTINFGIWARNYGTATALTIAAVDVVGWNAGIFAENHGTGATSITATGKVKGANNSAIYVYGISGVNYGTATALTITAVDVVGGYTGIYAFNYGTGATSITATGTVTGTSKHGIWLVDGGNAVAPAYRTITVADTALVEGGEAGISVESEGLDLTTINNHGVVQNLSGLSTDTAVHGDGISTLYGDARLSINNTGLITGTVQLGEKNNDFTNSGIWNTAGGTNEFGGGVGVNALTNEFGGMIIAASTGSTANEHTIFNNVGTFTNAGTLSMQNGHAGDTVTLQGSYVGQDGVVALDTVLDGDGSLSDLLIMDGGRASGNTYLQIANVGGLGALTTGDGINVVRTINGGTTDLGAFSLNARVAAGAYEYSLYRGGAANEQGWYLRSTMSDGSNYRPEVPVDMVVPALASRFGMAMLGTCDERMGAYLNGKATHCGDDAPRSTLWGRVFGETGDVRFGGEGERGHVRDFEQHGPSYDFSLGGVQAGMDIWGSETEAGSRNIAGMYVGAGTANATVDLAQGGRAGKTSMDSYSLGVYWTHKNATGFYVDAAAQGTRYANIRAVSDAEQSQSFKTSGWGFIGSVEGGYPVALGNGWTLTPQAQLVYQHLSFNNGSDDFGSISYDGNDVFTGRLGGRLNKDWALEDGRIVSTFARANVWHGFGAQATTTFTDLSGNNAVALKTDLSGTWGQVGLGVSGQLTKAVSVVASGDYNFAIDAGKGSSVSGRVGIKVAW